MGAFFVINYFGVRSFARINTPLTLVKFIMPVLIIAVFLTVSLHWHNITAGHFAPYGTAGVLQAIVTSGIIFAFLGFRQAVDLAGEAKNPHRDVPRAIMISIGIGILLYAALQVVFIAAVPPAALHGGWAHVAFDAPFAQLAVGLNLGWVADLLYVDAIISPSGTDNVYLASATRVLYALAENGDMSKVLARVDPKTSIPVGALVTALILGLLFLAPFPAWNQLVAVISSVTVLTYIMGPVSAAVFRRTAPAGHRFYRVPALKATGPVTFIIGTWIIYWTGWAVGWKIMVAHARRLGPLRVFQLVHAQADQASFMDLRERQRVAGGLFSWTADTILLWFTPIWLAVPASPGTDSLSLRLGGDSNVCCRLLLLGSGQRLSYRAVGRGNPVG